MNYDYLTDSRDRVLFGVTPVLLQPCFGGKLPEPEESKHRFVCGQDGLYIEARNKVIDLRQCIAPSTLPLPYGKIEQSGICLRNGRIPQWILMDAVGKSSLSVPNEWAGLVVWNEARSGYELFEPDVISATPGNIRYRNSIPDGLMPVMDLHSHGNGSAFFSPTDDRSDVGGFYIAGVIGNCASMNPSFVTRMVVNGHFLSCPDFRDFFAKDNDGGDNGF